ncbi:TetR/AcrR family transcriptional regulator [Nocardia sp. NPDC088792]|uniref:TetR/AcrR family transcriptional regulator n=1 Tax=Nocardia sp. NPDC088792 TaxID=3364332 RepID=UPI00381393B3
MPDATAPRDLRSDALRNQQELVRAATTAFHRDGLRVPMATIAAEAGVGVGTLYRHFPTREDLLNHLTHRSFEQVLANAQTAERDGATAAEALRLFIDAAIRQRNDLVLPLHGGPPVTAAETAVLRDRIHAIVQRIIDGGIAEGTLRPGVIPRDIVVFGSMLAQPQQADPDWDARCRRLLDTYLRGIRRHP